MKQVQLEHGALHYKELGEGLPVVFMHGALSNYQTWGRVIGPLSERFRCIAPTLPLGGHSVPMNEAADLTPPAIADLVAEFVYRLSLERFVLVGNDTGGAYAQIFAAKYPGKLRGLVLSNCDALDTFPPPQFSSLQSSIDFPCYTDLMALLFKWKPFLKTKWALGLLSSTLSANEIFENYVKGFVDNPGVRADFKKVVKGWSTRYTQEAAQVLAQLNIPTLLLWGEDEELFPASLAERLHGALPASQLVFIGGAKTYVQVDQPALFMKHFRNFVEKL